MAEDYKLIIREKKDEAKKSMSQHQFMKCNVAIHSATVASSAEALIPIPGVDTIPVTATQVGMVIALGKIFDQKITKSVAKGILAGTVTSIVGRNLIKAIPVAGPIASSVVTAGVTEAIGWTVAVDLSKKQFESDRDRIMSRKDIYKAVHIKLDDLDKMDDEEIFVNFSVVDEKTVENNQSEQYTPDNVESDDDESMSGDFSKCFDEEEE